MIDDEAVISRDADGRATMVQGILVDISDRKDLEDHPIPAGNFVSPPIPEHGSSVALYGAATAEILQSVLETDQVNIDLASASLPGTTITYTSIAQAARDNAVSKIYTGWNFRKSVLAGEKMGKQVAQYIYNNHFREN